MVSSPLVLPCRPVPPSHGVFPRSVNPPWEARGSCRCRQETAGAVSASDSTLRAAGRVCTTAGGCNPSPACVLCAASWDCGPWVLHTTHDSLFIQPKPGVDMMHDGIATSRAHVSVRPAGYNYRQRITPNADLRGSPYVLCTSDGTTANRGLHSPGRPGGRYGLLPACFASLGALVGVARPGCRRCRSRDRSRELATQCLSPACAHSYSLVSAR